MNWRSWTILISSVVGALAAIYLALPYVAVALAGAY